MSLLVPKNKICENGMKSAYLLSIIDISLKGLDFYIKFIAICLKFKLICLTFKVICYIFKDI